VTKGGPPRRLQPGQTCLGAHHRDPAFATETPEIRTGMAGLRIARNDAPLPPRDRYENAVARHYAELGYVDYAELLEAGYGCSGCHVTHRLNRIPTDAELDLTQFERVAIGSRIARAAVEIGAEAVIGASAQIEGVLARTVAEKITVRNMVDPVDPLTARKVAEVLLSDPVAYRSYRQLQMHGTEVRLDFGLGPARTMGSTRARENLVVVFVRNHGSPQEVVSTIVHEASHVHRFFRGSRFTVLDEVRARSREFLYQHGRRPTGAERRATWEEVRDISEYDGLPER
jgi:hypothetical protein